jgi:speckle-type POZ protein
MTELEKNEWGEVKWIYNGQKEKQIFPSYFEYEYQIAHLGLLLGFQSTPENCPTIQYSKVLDYLTTADLNVVVKGRIFPVHAALLVAASPVMAAMLDSAKSEEGRMKAVEISDVEPEVFQQLLYYISTGSAPRMAEEFITEHLFKVSDKYQIHRLKAECEKQMSGELKVDNVIRYLVAAYLHSAPTLQEASVRFLVERAKELWDYPEWKEFSVKYSDLFFLICRRIAEFKE